MTQRGSGTGLLSKLLKELLITRELTMEDLDRNIALQRGVLSLENSGR